MNGVSLVTDLFSLYVFLEITAVSSYVLIAFDRKKDGLEGAFKYLILSAVATLMMLASIGLFVLDVGDTSFAAVAKAVSALRAGGLGLDPPPRRRALRGRPLRQGRPRALPRLGARRLLIRPRPRLRPPRGHRHQDDGRLHPDPALGLGLRAAPSTSTRSSSSSASLTDRSSGPSPRCGRRT